MQFNLNGVDVECDSHPMSRLLDVLREEYSLTGTKEGCGEGECGACTVLIDGEPVCSCLVPVSQVASAEVVTIEGLGGDHPLQKLFMNEVGAQCGICTPGVVMASKALLEKNPDPTEQEVRYWLAGNLCRCTGYDKIIRAVLDAGAVMREEARS